MRALRWRSHRGPWCRLCHILLRGWHSISLLEWRFGPKAFVRSSNLSRFDPFNFATAALLHPGLSPHSIVFSGPSLKSLVAAPLFLFASGIQHDCHVYLSTLKRYTLPSHPLFKIVLCPHYTAECIFYLSLAIVAAPEGMPLNRTVAAALVFSTVNLSITAESTKEWYEKKFGKEKVKGRWRMLPYVY